MPSGRSELPIATALAQTLQERHFRENCKRPRARPEVPTANASATALWRCRVRDELQGPRSSSPVPTATPCASMFHRHRARNALQRPLGRPRGTQKNSSLPRWKACPVCSTPRWICHQKLLPKHRCWLRPNICVATGERILCPCEMSWRAWQRAKTIKSEDVWLRTRAVEAAIIDEFRNYLIHIRFQPGRRLRIEDWRRNSIQKRLQQERWQRVRRHVELLCGASAVEPPAEVLESESESARVSGIESGTESETGNEGDSEKECLARAQAARASPEPGLRAKPGRPCPGTACEALLRVRPVAGPREFRKGGGSRRE